jgi:hypothetical protein
MNILEAFFNIYMPHAIMSTSTTSSIKVEAKKMISFLRLWIYKYQNHVMYIH